MLTGELGMSSGTAYIAGLDIRKDMNKIRSKIGYCPQYVPCGDIVRLGLFS